MSNVLVLTYGYTQSASAELSLGTAEAELNFPSWKRSFQKWISRFILSDFAAISLGKLLGI